MAESSACSLLPRNANSYAIEGAVNLLANTGGLKTRGVDFEARYSMPLNFGIFGVKTGKLDFRISGTRLIQHDLNPLVAIPELTQKCAGKFGIYCGNPYSKLRLSNRLTYSSGPLTLSDNQEQPNSYPSSYDDYGRAFFVNASVKF